MARLEGFEPPTPRSEVLSNPQSDNLGKGKSLFLQASPLFYFSLVFVVTYQCGNKNGNIESTNVRRRLSNRDSQTRRDSVCSLRSFLDRFENNATEKTLYPQISYLRALQFSFIFNLLNGAVSKMFPRSAGTSSITSPFVCDHFIVHRGVSNGV